MGEAILQLCRDQELREQMATSMHQKAMDLASPEKIAQRQRFIYQELFFGRVDTSRAN